MNQMSRMNWMSRMNGIVPVRGRSMTAALILS
jgi:hypothetical protein